jgi:gas vesicle protein
VGFNYWSIGRGKKRGNSIGSRILYNGERKNSKDIPYLKGRDISRNGYVFGDHWLKYDYGRFLDKEIDIFRFSPEFLEVSPKIIYRQTADRIIAAMDFDKFYLDKTVHLIIPKENVTANLFALLGVLNSKLILYIYRDLVREEGRTFAQIKTIYIKKMPLKFNGQIEAKISELVKKQLEKTKRISEFGDKKTSETARLEEEIKKTDNEIDELVYNLYGITEEEKRIIEDGLKRK